jgi:hypothetical protein
VSFGQGAERHWDDARKYGFISAGGGKWYTQSLHKLEPGNRVFVNVVGTPGGYVGVGRVLERAQRAELFEVTDDSGKRVPLSTQPLAATNLLHHQKDDDLAETLVRVEWLKTVPLSEAIWENGMFANQNSACKLRSRFTIERLVERFGLT